VIRRRHVFYVEGYDPQGAEGYHGIFVRNAKRFLQLWPIALTVGKLQIDSELRARWDIEAAGPNWRTAVRYEFLRQEGIVRANMAQPIWRQVLRALRWALDDLASGTTFRVWRASPLFAAHLLFFQVMLVLWIAVAAGGGWLLGLAVTRLGHVSLGVGLPIGFAAAIVLFLLLKPLADRWFVVQINSCWPNLRQFARGDPSCFDHAIEACARGLVAAARDNEVDEIVVIGHSGGGAIAPAVVTHALELDPQVGRRGPPIVLMTLGSIAPGAALHPEAAWLRATFARLAAEASLRWIDCQSRMDIMNFWNFDPVEGIGVSVGAHRCNPMVWPLRFRDMLSPAFFRRMRFNFFRLHYQFIMANDRRAPYDYFMLVCGPVPVEHWARDPQAVLAAFAADASYAA
jgi:hypothetical protein